MPPAPRVSVRKKHGLRLGLRSMICTVGPQKKQYKLHEDLIFKSSPFFHRGVQPKRRDIEGDCPICHEELQEGIDALTYCSASCGGNFHHKCFAQWKRQSNAKAKCPLCRYDWVTPSNQTVHLTNTSERGFEIYVEWLYRGRILAENNDTNKCFEDLINAYITGMEVDDRSFCYAVLQSMIEVAIEDDTFPDSNVVNLAYSKTSNPSNLRKLLVEVYVRSNLTASHLRDYWDTFSREFLCDLTLFLMDAASPDKRTWTLEALTECLLP
ncbi:hypothetical protein OPT61_g2176 [Boeremia exigua]|uniref:Uncharacterized protein n=1 Tax=Boeremia exigua TaxID=749465 RepID=A0ACC2IMQ4_9PLEO|nr:hypothetical protein OPT61_g2176 [Boeremia exigua]